MCGHYRSDLRIKSHKDGAQGLHLYRMTKLFAFLFICLVQHPDTAAYVLDCVSLVSLETAHGGEKDSTCHKGDLVRSSYLFTYLLFL